MFAILIQISFPKRLIKNHPAVLNKSLQLWKKQAMFSVLGVKGENSLKGLCSVWRLLL